MEKLSFNPLCSIEHCTYTAKRRGMCDRHVKEFPASMFKAPPCTAKSCRKKAAAKPDATTDASDKVTDLNEFLPYCKKHQKYLDLYGCVLPPPAKDIPCGEKGCTRPSTSHGFCKKHYDKTPYAPVEKGWELSQSLINLVQITRTQQRRADRLARKHQIAPCW